jgi:hypothetical protein
MIRGSAKEYAQMGESAKGAWLLGVVALGGSGGLDIVILAENAEEDY